MSTHRWEDETVREGTGHLPLFAEVKKMMTTLLTLHKHGRLRVSA